MKNLKKTKKLVESNNLNKLDNDEIKLLEQAKNITMKVRDETATTESASVAERELYDTICIIISWIDVAIGRKKVLELDKYGKRNK